MQKKLILNFIPLVVAGGILILFLYTALIYNTIIDLILDYQEAKSGTLNDKTVKESK